MKGGLRSLPFFIIIIMRKILFHTLFFFCVLDVFPQQSDEISRQELEELIESTFADDETKDVEQLLTDLQYRREHPFNINTAEACDFESLYFLNPLQISALLEYRKKLGRILSPVELSGIDGFDEHLARLVAQFVVFGPEKEGKMYFRGHHEVVVRESRLLEEQAAYKDPKKFEGSPYLIHFRYRYSSATLSAGYTGEKDPGESFFRGSNKSGFDFNSAFIRFSPDKRKTIILGDYLVQFGQGLNAWQGFTLGKSSEAVNIARFNQGIKPFGSSDASDFMRGVAFSLNAGRFRFVPFLSYKKFDANTDSLDGKKIFTSFQTTGYHRTKGETEDERSVSRLVAGGAVGYEGRNFSVGVNGTCCHYQYPLVRDDELYYRYLFHGRRHANLSVDYQWSRNKLFVFGEFAWDCGRGFANITGLMYQLSDKVSLAASGRDIGKRYNSPLASSFTEGSRVNDERGLFFGASILPVAKVTVNMYADFFSYDWIKYTTAGPGKGREFMLQAGYNVVKDWQFTGRYFYECKPVKITSAYSMENFDQIRQSARLQLSGKMGPSFPLKSRFEQSFFRHDHRSNGFLISQDFGYRPEKSKVTAWFRVAYFNTGDYDARIYAYENDLLYSFSVPALYGEGMRTYLTGKVKICEKLEFRYKVSRSWYFGVQSIGSGYTEIEGNKRTEVKFQLRFRI